MRHSEISKFIELHGGIADGIIAVKNKKIDAFANDYPVVAAAVAQNPELAISPVRGVPEKYGIALSKGNNLTPKIEKIVSEFEKDGTLTRLNDIWLGNDEKLKILPKQDWSYKNGVLRVAADDSMYPMVYVANNELAGYDVHLALLIGKELEKKVEFVRCNSAGRIPSISSAKADCVISSEGVLT